MTARNEENTFAGLAAKVMIICGTIAFWWILVALDQFMGIDLKNWGIIPRQATSLPGIVFSPFLHLNWAHVAANTTGFFIFGGIVILRGTREFIFKTVFIILVGGLGVWIFGRSAVHIGASGLIFGYFGFILSRAWHERKPLSIIIAVALLILFGGMLWSVFPNIQGCSVSWEAHLFGFLAGVIGAKLVFGRNNGATAGKIAV
ncbi:MAG: rhomboid family intramembrane serine protease [Planctomycetes bacterium]|nr:rhomboid family intramembrane serine protease [Planctomycetota bacterium]